MTNICPRDNNPSPINASTVLADGNIAPCPLPFERRKLAIRYILSYMAIFDKTYLGCLYPLGSSNIT
jgi:hypothetical protein